MVSCDIIRNEKDIPPTKRMSCYYFLGYDVISWYHDHKINLMMWCQNLQNLLVNINSQGGGALQIPSNSPPH